MFRHWAILGATVIAATAYDNRARIGHLNGDGDDVQNVILVVSDGLRWQEVFAGADSAILFGDPSMLGGNADAIRRKYWRATATERRAALMPLLS